MAVKYIFNAFCHTEGRKHFHKQTTTELNSCLFSIYSYHYMLCLHTNAQATVKVLHNATARFLNNLIHSNNPIATKIIKPYKILEEILHAFPLC